MDRVTREVRLMTDELFRATGVHLTALALRAGSVGQWQTGDFGTNFGGRGTATPPPPPAAAAAAAAATDADATPGARSRHSRERRNRGADREPRTERHRDRDRNSNRNRDRNRNHSRTRSRSRHRTPQTDRGEWQRLRMWSEENLERIRDLSDLHDVIDRRLERVLRDRDRREHNFSTHARDRRSRSHYVRLHSRFNREERHHRNNSRHRSRERSTQRSHGRHRHRRRSRSSNRHTDRSHRESANEASPATHCRSEEHTVNPAVETHVSGGALLMQGVEQVPVLLRDDEGPFPDYSMPILPSTSIHIIANASIETQSADSGSINSN